MGQGQSLWSQKPPHVHGVDGGYKIQLDVLCVHLVLTFFQSSKAVPSTLRIHSKPVKPNSRSSWSLNEGGWYALSGWEEGEQGAESKFPRRNQGLPGPPTLNPKASCCPLPISNSTTCDLVRDP